MGTDETHPCCMWGCQHAAWVNATSSTVTGFKFARWRYNFVATTALWDERSIFCLLLSPVQRLIFSYLRPWGFWGNSRDFYFFCIWGKTQNHSGEAAGDVEIQLLFSVNRSYRNETSQPTWSKSATSQACVIKQHGQDVMFALIHLSLTFSIAQVKCLAQG